MDNVYNQYMDFLEIQNTDLLSVFPKNDLTENDKKNAGDLLKKIISTANDFTANYYSNPDIVKHGFGHALERHIKALEERMENDLFVFSETGRRIQLSGSLEHHMYYIGKGLLAFVLSEGASLVIINVVYHNDKNIVEMTFEVNSFCLGNLPDNDQVIPLMIMDHIRKSSAALTIIPFNGLCTPSGKLMVSIGAVPRKDHDTTKTKTS